MKKIRKKSGGKILFNKHWHQVADVFDDWLDAKAVKGEFPPLKPWLLTADEWRDLLGFEKSLYG